MTSVTYTKDMVLKAIEGSGGIVSAVAQRLGCAWKTADNLVKRWAEVREAFMAEREKVLDIAETTLIKSIQNGDTQDAKWMLSKRGKARGYGDAMEFLIKNLDLSALSDDQLRRIASGEDVYAILADTRSG